MEFVLEDYRISFKHHFDGPPSTSMSATSVSYASKINFPIIENSLKAHNYPASLIFF